MLRQPLSKWLFMPIFFSNASAKNQEWKDSWKKNLALFRFQFHLPGEPKILLPINKILLHCKNTKPNNYEGIIPFTEIPLYADKHMRTDTARLVIMKLFFAISAGAFYLHH